MCELCEKDGLLKVEIVYHYIPRVVSTCGRFERDAMFPKETHITVEKCPICGRDLRSGINDKN